MEVINRMYLAIDEKTLKAFVKLVVDELRNEFVKPVDEKHLTVPELSKVINIGPPRIRKAIRAGYYGFIHRGQREIFYATATEARAYHFGEEGKGKRKSGLK